MRRSTFLEVAPYVIVAAVLLASSGRPYHVDDGTFLLYARCALKDPLHPYGPYGIGVASNPPGMAWLLAVVVGLVGFSERAVHLMLAPLSLCAVAGARWLAREAGVEQPWRVALFLACSGPFLLSATTLMPDAQMLGFLLPALALVWSDARAPRAWKVALACALFAWTWTLRINAAPVLAAAALWQLWRGNRRALWPLAALVAAFALWTWLSHAPTTAGGAQTLGTATLHGSFGAQLVARVLSTADALILFTPVIVALVVLQPRHGARRGLELAGLALALATPFVPLAVVVALAAVLLLAARLRLLELDGDAPLWWLWIGAALAVPVLYNQATAKFLNLLLVPAALLIFRRATDLRRTLAVCGFGLAVALPVTVADSEYAAALKSITLQQIAAMRADGARKVYVAGTPWGAVEYARQQDAYFLYGTVKRGSWTARMLEPGDELLDLSHPGALAIPADAVRLVRQGEATSDFPIRTMAGGAGLWSSDWGIVPFAVSREPLQPWWVVRVVTAYGK